MTANLTSPRSPVVIRLRAGAAAIAAALLLAPLSANAQFPPLTPAPAAPAAPASTASAGEVKGTAWAHTAQSGAAAIAQAAVVLPATLLGQPAGSPPWVGLWRDVPRNLTGRAPVVVFLHGSSGLALPAIAEWQRWLASLGVASVAPDSFALPDRITYKSPVPKEVYERIHALRASEIPLATAALAQAPWADTSRMLLVGSSEGATAVARHGGLEFAGRILYAWSCETNYFVTEPRTAVVPERPILNVISSADVFFSSQNPFIGNPNAVGHCGPALKDHKQATIVLIPGAPHTVLGLPAARNATASFVRDVLKP